MRSSFLSPTRSVRDLSLAIRVFVRARRFIRCLSLILEKWHDRDGIFLLLHT